MSLKRALWVVVPIAMTLPLGCKDDGGGAAGVGSASAPIVQGPAPSGSAMATTMPSAAASADHAADAHGPRGHHGGGGVSGMLFHAAHELPDLKDPQKTMLETLEKDLHGDMGDTKAAFKTFQSDLITGVKAGKIDTAKFEPDYVAIENAMKARQDKEATAMNGLYAALEPAQRKELTTAVRAKQAEREAHMAEHKADAGKPGDAEWAKRRLDRMTKELDLDDAQQKSVAAAMAKSDQPKPADMDAMHDAMKKRNEAVLAAFEADSFDAKKLDLSPMPGKKARDPLVHQVQFLSLLMPILKPEQAVKLATRMEKPMMPHPHGPTGGPTEAEEESPQYGLLFDDPHGEEAPATPAAAK